MRRSGLAPLGLAACLSALSACASMSADQCLTADWRSLGEADGAKGKPLTQIDGRTSACSKHGVTPDFAAYQAGREQGLARYCVPATARALGEDNASYGGQCASHGEEAFLQAFEEGRLLFAYMEPARRARAEISEVQDRVSNISDILTSYEDGSRPFEAEGHNEKVLELWAERNWLRNVTIPHWESVATSAGYDADELRMRIARNDPDVWSARPASRLPEPKPFPGATDADAQAMLREVFARAKAGTLPKKKPL